MSSFSFTETVFARQDMAVKIYIQKGDQTPIWWYDIGDIGSTREVSYRTEYPEGEHWRATEGFYDRDISLRDQLMHGLGGNGVEADLLSEVMQYVIAMSPVLRRLLAEPVVEDTTLKSFLHHLAFFRSSLPRDEQELLDIKVHQWFSSLYE